LPPKKIEKTYRVANPRGIPQGRFIVCVQKGDVRKDWFEGDAFDPADAFSPEDFKAWLKNGFIEEVTDDKE